MTRTQLFGQKSNLSKVKKKLWPGVNKQCRKNSYKNLKTTFSYLNCSLQFDKLNRGAWRELEAQERVWANKFGTLKVRVVLEFKEGHMVLPTGGHVPSGYFKYINFPNGDSKCYYFPNSTPTKHWSEYEYSCKRRKSVI